MQEVFNYYDVELSEIKKTHDVNLRTSEFYGSIEIIGSYYDVSIVYDCMTMRRKVLLTLTFYDSQKNIKKVHRSKYSNLDSLQKAINSILLFKKR